jgi:hypothetical protein
LRSRFLVVEGHAGILLFFGFGLGWIGGKLLPFLRFFFSFVLG